MEVSDDKFIELFENVASIKTSNTSMSGILTEVRKDIIELREFTKTEVPKMIEEEVKNCQGKYHPPEGRKDKIERRKLTEQELKYKKALTIGAWISAISLLAGILLSLRALI